MKIQALNGKDDQLTLTALKQAAGKATGKARATIQGLIGALTSQPAARGRSAKELLSMKKHKKRATKTAPKKHNPTPAKKAYRPIWHKKAKHNPTPAKRGGGGFKLNLPAILDVVKEGALVAAGSLGSSFLERQAERILPDLNPSIRTIGATVVLAGGALFLGGKAYGKPVAVGAIAEGVRSLGRNFAPELFAGTDGQMAGATGYWDENGQWVEAGMSGIAYDLTGYTPILPNRPAGM